MKIATWNVNGIRAREVQLLDWLARERPDIVCLQEIKAPADRIPPMLAQAAGYWCRWHGSGGYSGVALLVREGLTSAPPPVDPPPFDFESRALAATIGEVTVVSAYVPNGGRDMASKFRFVADLQRLAEAHREADRPLVICGDLNIAREERDVHPKERKPTAIGQLPEERAAFARLLGAGLVDVARALDPDNDALFTWWAPWRNLRQRNIGWRIDYILASESLAARAIRCTSQREIGTSDHAPVIAEFDAWPGLVEAPPSSRREA
jgi:exodeoxyribonuclease-3